MKLSYIIEMLICQLDLNSPVNQDAKYEHCAAINFNKYVITLPYMHTLDV